MKMTRSLIEFIYNTGLNKFEAIGLVDQLNELSSDYDLASTPVGLIAVHLGVPEKYLTERDIIGHYLTLCEGQKRDKARDKKRTQRGQNGGQNGGQDRDNVRDITETEEREALPPDGPSSPTPPISPLPPTEIKNNNINNAHTRERLPRRRFVRPTHDELAAYAKELGYDGFDAGRFMDYYDANGWTVGKDKPMKDWKAAVRTWKRNDDERRGVKPVAERERDTDEDVFAGLTEEQIEEYRRLARDGKHWG